MIVCILTLTASTIAILVMRVFIGHTRFFMSAYSDNVKVHIQSFNEKCQIVLRWVQKILLLPAC